MKIDKNQVLFAGGTVRDRNMTESDAAAGKKQNANIYAGDLNKVTDPVWQKKQEARKKAMKIVSDAWDGERKIDTDLAERREKIRQLQEENGGLQKELNTIAEEQEALKEVYGIDTDSEEYKDLEVLLKRKRSEREGSDIHLTEEEYEQLAEIDKKAKTEYQSRVLELEESADYYHRRLEENKQEIYSENAIIRGTRLERLKHDPVGKAKKQADAVLEAASEEILGMLTDEGLEHLKEEQKEKEEQAEKAEEKREEKEELLEKNRTEREKRREWAEELAESMSEQEILQLEKTQNEVQQEIQSIMDKMKLVAEDMKGAAVDKVL